MSDSSGIATIAEELLPISACPPIVVEFRNAQFTSDGPVNVAFTRAISVRLCGPGATFVKVQ